ncbi:hypothetical protein J437_LFUL019119 [Ladona fulva]|uniref:Retrotransposon gag domain-containing protein n=1 Tax=Ladona fulva TaxID=123851 RepID=A0A8K0KT58_LADFU|nr:hypothetical protein J437_LFUL019119 [Ladona fulva]
MAEAIAKQMCKFSFHDKEKLTWDSYIFQFEQMCRVKEHLEAVRNFFYPNEVNTKTYEQVKEAFQSLYKPELTIFAARMEFNAAIHQDGEILTQWANRLRNLIRSCDYSNALDEQLRD